MLGTLKVEVDEPGRRLVLSSEDPALPKGLAALVRGSPFIVVLLALGYSGAAGLRANRLDSTPR